MTRRIETICEIQACVAACRQKGMSVGFVPTMGAFHLGHLSLMNQARRENDAVIVSIFVNPLQFSAGEDYDRYPRRLQQDQKMAESENVDAIFIPSVAELYPKGFDSFVDQTDLPAKLCGAFRPGHFRGVMTIVCKLFNIVQPDTAYFGQKDYQQYLIIRRMATDLNLGVRVRLMPTVREEDGLAMSSRNTYLNSAERASALCLYQSIQEARKAVAQGELKTVALAGLVRAHIESVAGTEIDYVSFVDAGTLAPVATVDRQTLLALAVRINGKVRLIDNGLVLKAD